MLCLQELKCSDETVPARRLRELGYEAAVNAAGRWNGVAVLSRVGLDDVVTRPARPARRTRASMEPRAVAATCGPVRVWSVYVPNGREVGHAALRVQAGVARGAAGRGHRGRRRRPRPFAVLGDYNIAPTDEDVWDLAAFEGPTHVTQREREALAALREAGPDRHRAAPAEVRPARTPTGTTASCASPKQGHAHRPGLRQRAVRQAVADAYVDREERKGKGASDHAPVVVDLDV